MFKYKLSSLFLLLVILLMACSSSMESPPIQAGSEPTANQEDFTVSPTAQSNATEAVTSKGDTNPYGQPENGDERGFILFSPLRSTETYLINYDGDVLHTWPSEYNPSHSVYLLENGNLLRTGSLRNKNFDAGGKGGIVQEIDWDGDVVWEFNLSSDQYLLHHDIEQLPNGNILMIAWEHKTSAEAIAAGRNPDLLADGELWPDVLIEVNPKTNQIVWEWHVWDHLVQDYDADKLNYGNPAEHPELIDLNYATNNGADWNHTNSVDYNPSLDQIVISVHNFSEIWIIDHNTTTAEAAGPAGDLLYRWGNPQTYGAGTSADQQLFVQHDAQWIESGLPGAGNILILNNGSRRSRPYSSIEEIVTPLNSDGSYKLISGNAYGPSAPIWTYQAATATDFYAQNISGAQRLPNGNTLICNGPAGRFFEVTPIGDTVWEYVNQFGENAPSNDKNAGAGKMVFRANYYPGDYAGLAGRELIVDLDTSADQPEDAQEKDEPSNLSYPIVDTDQGNCYGATTEMNCPSEGQSFYGQDAQYDGNQPSYTDNGDGTITDNVTGLMWQKDPGAKITYQEAAAGADSFTLAGYDDWRLPTIKELYSLIQFDGLDPGGSSANDMIPFIDADNFNFEYGDESTNERIIDSQWATSSLYSGNVMNGQQAMFGVNFAD